MAVTIDWADTEQKILRMTFDKAWTWSEYHEASDLGKAMVNEIPHKFTVVLDFTDSGPIPPSAFTHFKRGLRNQHPNRRMVIIISKRRMLAESMISVMMKLFPKTANIRFAHSFEEAQRLIADTAAKDPVN